MKDTLAFLVKNLVENKDAVKIEETADNDGLFFHVFVKKDDIGKVVGKNGKVAASIRTIIRAIGNHNHVRASIKFDAIEE